MPSIDFTWDVSNTTPGGGGSGAAPAFDSGRQTEAAIADPLGSGLIRPFRRTERSDFLQGFGVPEVLSAVGQVLGTQLGVLPWEPGFGCDLERLRHHSGATNADLARIFVQDALQRWEPRAQLTSVDLVPAAENEISLRATTRIGSKNQTVNVTV